MSEAKPIDAPIDQKDDGDASNQSTGTGSEKAGLRYQEQLIDCLAYISRWADRPRSVAALTAGLPWPKDDESRKPEAAFLIKAAERAGFEAKQLTTSLAKLDATALPAILMTATGPAVLLRLDGAAAEVYRPNKRDGDTIRKVSRSKLLEKKLIGPIIAVKPATDWNSLAESSARPETASTLSQHWFWGPVLENRWLYTQVALASLMINLFGLATPLFVMNVYDRVLPNSALETGWALGLGALTVFLFDFLLRGLRGYFIDVAGRRADLKLAGRLFDHVLDIKLDQAQRRSSGALANMLREFESVREFFTSATLAALVDLPFVFLFLGVIYMIGGPIAFGLTLAVMLIIGVGALLQWPMRRLIERNQIADDSRHGLTVARLGGLETIRSTGADRRLRARYADLLAESTIYGQRSRFWSMMGIHTAILMQQVASVFVILVGMYLVADGTLTVGGLIACVILGSRSIAPLGQVAHLATRFQQARHALQGLNKLMEEPVERPGNRRFLHREVLHGDIRFEAVNYAYPNSERLALQNISFHIKPGEKVGLIGRVGSGKSTIARLLCGLTEPQSGIIHIDGTDMAQLDPADLRRNVALVPQETFLLRGSLRDNIAAARPDASDAEILEAATLAGVHDFAARHPHGYDMRIGERGLGLSGGQRQAVAIARALLGNANTLILDEATNAMDIQGETLLTQRLQPFLENRGLVLITHRQNMLNIVDRRIILGRGHVVADGPRDEVMAALGSGQIKAAAGKQEPS